MLSHSFIELSLLNKLKIALIVPRHGNECSISLHGVPRSTFILHDLVSAQKYYSTRGRHTANNHCPYMAATAHCKKWDRQYDTARHSGRR